MRHPAPADPQSGFRLGFGLTLTALLALALIPGALDWVIMWVGTVFVLIAASALYGVACLIQ